MKDCCNHSKKDKKCIRNDKKTFKLPRRFSKNKFKKIKGFTMRSSCAPYKDCFNKTKMKQKGGKQIIAYFSGGCFWGLEKKLKNVVGVKKTQVGYMGGKKQNPTYELICSGKTNHAETVKVFYDNQKITYEELVNIFFNLHDPTTLNKQGPDIGKQYRSIVFYKNKKEKQILENIIKKISIKKEIVTELLDSTKYKFYKAEKHHQNYLDKKKTKYLTPLGIKWVEAASEDMKKRIQSQEGGKKSFLYNPDNPKKSFDVYIDKNPKDTIPIKFKTVSDVKNTIKKLERLYKKDKYTHKRIWQVAMIMKVRLEVLKKNKPKQYQLSKKYFKFLGNRTKIKDNKSRKKFTMKL